MRVYWLTQQQSDVPADDEWLTAAERAGLAGLRVPKRRHDWRLGRWTAKQALAAYLDDGGRSARTLARLEVRATEDGAPEAFVDGQPAPVTLSISHSAASALCALGPRPVALGCDVERIEPRAAVFVTDYFTPAEGALVAAASAAARDVLVTAIWSAKESGLKALRQGLRLNTRAVEVRLRAAEPSASWQPIVVQYEGGAIRFHGWWRCSEGLVYSVVTDSCDATLTALQRQQP